MLESLRTAREAERKKLKEMSFKEKIGYIWEYYRLQIIGVVIVLCILGSIINNVFINPPKKIFSQFIFYGTYVDDELCTKLSEKIGENVITLPEKERVISSSFYISTNDPEVNMAMAQRFFAMVAAKEIDLMIVKPEDYEELRNEDYFIDLASAFGQEFVNQYADILLKGKTKSQPEERYYGIKLDDNAFFKSFNMKSDGFIMAPVINSERLENTSKCVNYMLGFK